jgi:hypothetical protein
MDLISGAFDPGTVHDPNAWQPLTYRDASGAVVTPGFVGAQWQHVAPFALTSSGIFVHRRACALPRRRRDHFPRDGTFGLIGERFAAPVFIAVAEITARSPGGN